MFTFPIWAQTKFQLERLNFFPTSKAYAIVSYQYELTDVDTPKQTTQTNEIKNYSNSGRLDYGHKLARDKILGIRATYTQTSENALRYGIPLRSRFNSRGMSEPEYYFIYRMRNQTEKNGNIDLVVTYLDNWGSREVGNNQAYQEYHGRNIISLGLKHGKKEEEWEFQTSLDFTYYDEGEEENAYTDKSYQLQSLRTYGLTFGSQYQASEWLYFHGSIGVIYRETETISDNEGDVREIQAGSGSVFSLGIKVPLSDWNLLHLHGNYSRNEYFVKGTGFNLDGRMQTTLINLSFIQAF
ncbi:hypothetical protein ACJVC5_13215 [Peredibacter sp. HCB2-198]|uniref:hypothetical protein n=1 Tax=Peredibacter sp. HCB2-198 TaxID=3383025 RepID=UPI0038B59893